MNSITLGWVIMGVLFSIFAISVLWFGKIILSMSTLEDKKEKCKNLN